jgi:microsomal dipeptidase-like Zn-dependent dipeptidase
VTAVDGFMTWSRKDAPKAMSGPFPPRAGVARYVDQFDYLKHLVGVDHIGLGPDFINDLEPIDPSKSIEFPPEMTYVQPVTLKYIEGFESVDGLGKFAPKWRSAATRPKRSRKSSAATGCASIARRGIRRIPPTFRSSA